MADNFTKIFVNQKTGKLETIGATKITALDSRTKQLRVGSSTMPGTDTHFFVSGSIGGKQQGMGVATFGGDLIISGNLYAKTLSGSLTQLEDGTSYLVAGTGISITSGSAGQVTIDATGATSAGGFTDDGANVRLTTASDKVGIGTPSPQAKFEISSTVDPINDLNDGLDYQLVLRNHQNTNDKSVGIGFQVSTAASSLGAAIIHKRDDSYSKGSLNFYTKNTATNFAHPELALTITNDQKVGIGTDAPIAKLEIKTSDSDNIVGVLIDHNETGAYKALEIDSESTSQYAATIKGKYPLALEVDIPNGLGMYVLRDISEAGSNPLAYIHDNNVNNTQTSLKVRQDGTGDIINLFDGGTEVFTVKDGGNTGVGTSSPNEKLTVEGVISLDEQGSAPSTTSGYGKVYVKSSDSKLYYKNDSGSEFDLTAAASGFAPTSSQYITLATDGALANERVLTAGDGVTITDAGAGSSVTLSLDTNLSDFDFSTGVLNLEDTVQKTTTTDSGTATASSHSVSIVGGEGIDTSAAGSTITISSEVASTSNKGAASFNVGDFTLSSGHVSLDDNITKTLGSDSGTATTSTHSINIVGSGAISTSATGNTVTIASSAGAGTMSSFDLSADSGTSETINNGNTLNISGGTGINTIVSSADTVTANIDNSIVATLSGSTFSGNIVAQSGLSGSLQNIPDGSSYLVASSNITIVSASNGQVIISSTDTNTDTTYSGGTGLDLSGTTFSIDNSIVATISGSTFVGATLHNAGLSGSLTQLIDGSSYLIAGSNVTIASASNGAVTITSTDTDTNTTYSAGTGIELSGTTFNILDSVVATLSGSTFAGDIVAQSGLSGSLQNLSDGSSYLIAGSNVTIASASSGQITISSADTDTNTTYSAGSGLNLSSTTFTVDNSIVATISGSTFTGATLHSAGLSGSLTQLVDGSSYLVAGSNITIASASNGAVTVSSSAASGLIGSAEDGVYTDGLFTDFTSSTPTGTAIDRFNEILKALAPGPAPALDDIDCNDSGVSGKLSFGSSNAIVGYTNSNTTAGFSAVDVNGTYSSTSSGNNLRRGIFNGSTIIDGDLNEDISSNSVNYPANSFGNAEQGTLNLEVNGSVIHSISLTSDAIGTGSPGSGSGSHLNGNSSGFVSMSVTGSAHFDDNTELDVFQHRTGRYQIGTLDQRDGWNYARIVHTISAVDTTTNYIEWINDSDSNSLSVEGTAFDSLSMTGTKNLSGVKYHTGGSAEYRSRVLNAYRNIYSTSNITFGVTRVSISSQTMPSINIGSGEDETKVLHLTGSATISSNPIFNSSLSVSTNVSHPIKSNLSSAGSQSIGGILLYNLSDTSTITSETFRGESYRLLSGSYNAQSNVTSVGNAWDSTTSLTGVDGMMFYNSALRSPKQGIGGGDFRNSTDGGSIANGPSSNVNYSSITGTRTFYRKFQNTTGGSKTNFNITINGSGNIIQQGSSLGTGNVSVLCKLSTTPGAQSTGWMDISQSFTTGNVSDRDGCLVGTLDTTLNATNEATFGTQYVANNEWVVIKIETDASYTGNISSMSISWV